MWLEENIWERRIFSVLSSLEDASTLLLFRRDEKWHTSIVMSYLFLLLPLPPAESLLFPGLLLLFSTALWSDNCALSFCSLKKLLLFNSIIGLEEEYTLFNTF